MTLYLDGSAPQIVSLAASASRSVLMRAFIVAGFPLQTSGETAPRQIIPVIARSRKQETAVFPMRWGMTFPPEPGKSAGAFVTHAPFERARRRNDLHRCVVPASWVHVISRLEGKQVQYIVQPSDADMTWIAGMYRMEDKLPAFFVLSQICTEHAAILQQPIPVMLRKEDIPYWIDPGMDPMVALGRALSDFIVERGSSQ
ncbi:MAG: SOS response-associated peptidase family protein [Clostridia bacterium]|nr:SOS response-associated peptidase family protein [Clostridia bacterium]